MKKLLILAASALVAACQTNPGYTLQGTLTGGDALTGKAYLQRQSPDGHMATIDSADIADGRFTMTCAPTRRRA